MRVGKFLYFLKIIAVELFADQGQRLYLLFASSFGASGVRARPSEGVGCSSRAFVFSSLC